LSVQQVTDIAKTESLGVYTIQQTSSKLPANVGPIQNRPTHANAGRLLDVCWTFAWRLLEVLSGTS